MKKHLIKNNWKYILIIVPITIVSLLEVYSIDLISKLFDDLSINLNVLGLIAVAVVFVIIVTILNSRIIISFSISIYNLLTIDFLDKYSSSSISKKKGIDDAKFYKVVIEDVKSITEYITVFLLSIISSLILVLSVAVYMIYKYSYIGLTIVFVLIIMMVFMSKYGKVLNTNWQKQKQVDLELKNNIGDFGYNSQDVLQPIYYSVMTSKYTNILSKYFKFDKKAVISGYNLWVASLLAFLLTKIFIIYYMLTSSNTGYGVGDTIAVVMLFELIEQPITNLRYQLESLSSVNASLKRYEQTLNGLDVVSFGDEYIDNLTTISFDEFYFSYDDITQIEAAGNKFTLGDIVQICGDSGLGKTTFLNVILNLEKSNNTIFYNDTVMSNLSKEFYRDNILYMDQNTKIENTKVKDFFEKPMDFDNIDVNCLMRKEELNMSSGEFQLFLLSKCYYTDAKVIVIDEMTSEMDINQEYTFFKELEKLNDKIIFFVSHKSENAKYCNKQVHIKKRSESVVR